MQQPNILVLMTDQQRADCLGSAGHPHVRTPSLDRLAREGVRFEQFHTTCPICMPARSSCLSGLYCHNHGQWTNQGQLADGTQTFMTALRDAGYRTCHIGKAHLHAHHGDRDLREMVPFMNALGFDDVLESTGPWASLNTESIMTEEWREKGILEIFRQDYRERQRLRAQEHREALWPSPMPEGETLDDFVGRTAVKYLADYDRDAPFCTFVGFGGPHEPWDPPASWADRYDSVPPEEPLPSAEKPEWLPARAAAYADAVGGRKFLEHEWQSIRRLYYAKISHIDSWIGRILETLEQRGLLRNTFILMWSDHGERLCDRGGLHKMVFYDESVRVPLILRRPDGWGAGSVASGLCETTDLRPTLLDAAGLDPSGCLGTSLLPAMSAPEAPIHDAVFSEIDHFGFRATMVRDDRHKMVVDRHANVLQLFDIQNDPRELVNLAGRDDAASTVHDLQARILRWRLETDVPQAGGAIVTVPSERSPGARGRRRRSRPEP